MISRIGIKTALFGLAANFILFLVKLYVSISSGSLAIYCDGVNNLGDTVSCIIALVGFLLTIRLNERKSNRTQSLATFVIGLILAVTGGYFAYNGVERLMYPVPISYQRRYAVLIGITIFVKLAMGIIYLMINKKQPSPVFKTLIMDSLLDCAVTASALIGLTLAVKINFAADGIISVAIGVFVAVGAIKTIVQQGKALIND